MPTIAIKKGKRTNNDLQHITHITKDRVTRTPLKTGGEPSYSGRIIHEHNVRN